MPTLPAKVLVAEDEALVRVIACEVLKDAGYEVSEAGDGREALDALESAPDAAGRVPERAPFDLLITDIQMPRMNGYQLAEAALARWPSLKILLVTGYTRENEPELVRRAGLRTLQKPFDVDRLPVIVAELLGRG
ncbi:MAG: response regulator [Alphaproteobacteria bacterium]|nr:response regulator [Alphaproteobacteria bacterium]